MEESPTKYEQAFALFDEGKTASSDEIKALKLKGNVKYNYYSEWRKARGLPVASPESKGESKERIKPMSELAMMPPQQEEVGDKALGEGEGEAKENEQQPTGAKKLDESPKGTDGKKPQATVIPTQGLVVTSVAISTKTYMLYQITAAKNEGEVTFGDFVDACVEDSFQGRGLDLGLLKVGGKDNNG